MACQCGVNAIIAGEEHTECACATDPQANCQCASGALSTSDRELALERVVMQLDKRLRRLERARI